LTFLPGEEILVEEERGRRQRRLEEAEEAKNQKSLRERLLRESLVFCLLRLLRLLQPPPAGLVAAQYLHGLQQYLMGRCILGD
jgi:hypothetical protein